MRTITPNTSTYQYALTKSPRYVISIQFANDDIVYFTSHPGTPVPPGATQVYQGVIEAVSGTTQQINPDRALSTIGNISFGFLDYAGEITDLFFDKDQAGKGLRDKRMRVYFGFDGLAWDDIEDNLIQTQIIKNYSQKDGVYTLKCADVQRSARKDIFELAKTTLSQTMTETQMLVPIYSADGFQLLQHGPTFTDAPNVKVLYVKIDDEVIRCTGTTTDVELGLCFVVHANGRGALGTRPAIHEVDTSSSSDRSTEVQEFVYLEMPAVELMYGILTGNYYTQPGENFPDKWHLNIPGEYVRTADFVNIGFDLWDPVLSDGFILRFQGEDSQDGKKFIEEQLNLVTSTFNPIYSNGEWGLRRFTSILSQAPSIFTLDESNIVRADSIDIDSDSVFNILSIEWNYDFLQDKLSRQKILIDSYSRGKYGDTPSKSLKFHGLHGSRHTATTVEGLFDRLRDRFAAPPIRMKIRVLPFLNSLEVGDIVRVKLGHLRDPFTGTSLDRSFEIQQVSVNWYTGQVDLTLFGSTHPADLIIPGQPADGPDGAVKVIEDAWYTSAGTNIVGYGGVTTSVVGGIRHITGGTGLVGNDVLSSGRYYHDGDLEIDPGVVLPFTKNVMLVVKGHLQINGTLNGIGRGKAGAAQVPAAGYGSHALGTKGFLGPTLSGGGYYDEYRRISGESNNQTWINSTPGYVVDGNFTASPRLQIAYDPDSNVLSGLPDDLQGTSGSTGHATDYSETVLAYIRGGAGGDSGAGLVIVARGISFGAAGLIRTNGNDGGAGDGPTENGYGGAGAGGAAGAVYLIIDGLNNDVPDLTHVECIWGKSPIPVGANVMSAPSVMVKTTSTVAVSPPYYGYYVGYGNNPPDLSYYSLGARILFVPPVNTSGEDTPVTTDPATAISLQELTNTPKSAAGNLSTVEITVTAPSATNYKYSNVYYRLANTQDAWTLITRPADDETDVVLPTDGKSYTFIARPVSIFGIENEFGPSATITLTDVINPPVDDNPTGTVLKVPNVSGLEIANQGSNTDFVGTDVNLVWRRTSDTEWVSPTIDGPLANGANDLYFSHYQMLVYDTITGSLMREQILTAPAFKYTFAMNAEDTQKIDLGAYIQPRRMLRFEIYQWSRQGIRSEKPAKLTVNNPASAQPTGVSFTVGALSTVFNFTRPTDPDWAGIKLYISETTSFTPDDDVNLVYKGSTSGAVVQLNSDTTYYAKFIPFDVFGDSSVSAEYTFTTGKIVGADIDGLGPWATLIDPVDAAWILAKFENDSIDSTKIANLTAAKLTAGVILVTLTLQSTGNIQVVNGSFVTTIGIHNVSGTNYAIRTFDGASSSFSVTDNGILRAAGAIISGAITITGGSGYANLSDKPTNLSGINSSEGTKLSGIAAGADVTNTVLTAGTTITGGGITLSAGGNIKGGQTAYATGTGFFLGYESSQYRFSIGSSTKYARWDGTDLLIGGGGLDVGTVGYVRGGKTAPGSGVGFFLGYSSSVYQMDVGDTTAEKFIRFDGTDLIVGRNTQFKGALDFLSRDIYLNTTFNLQSEWSGSADAGTNSDWASGQLRLQIQGAAAAGSLAEFYYDRGRQNGAAEGINTFSGYTWGKNRRFVIALRTLTLQANTAFFIGIGNNDGQSGTNQNHAGISFRDNGTTARFYFSNGTSSAKTETQISSQSSAYYSSNNVYYILSIEFISGTSIVFTLYDWNTGSVVATATHTTNLPTGTDYADRACQVALMQVTGSAATTSNIYIGEWRFLQKY